jgi:O-acetyl-ADP-ribose deacetylase (regulator of RNase III)
MTINYIDGDLLASNERIIAHGCNTRGVMGAGIAAQIAKRWPDLLAEYKHACYHDQFVLGSALRYHDPEGIIFNLGTQIDPGADARAHGITLSFANMFQQMAALWHSFKLPMQVGIPRIGCGIGGLKWPVVETLIKLDIQHVKQINDLDVTVNVYDLFPWKD